MKYGNEGTNCYAVKLHTFFIFSVNGDMCSASGSEETAHSNCGWDPETVTTW